MVLMAANDGRRLVEVRCPACGRLLFKVRPSDPGAEIEIKCKHGDCKSLVLVGADLQATVLR